MSKILIIHNQLFNIANTMVHGVFIEMSYGKSWNSKFKNTIYIYKMNNLLNA